MKFGSAHAGVSRNKVKGAMVLGCPPFMQASQSKFEAAERMHLAGGVQFVLCSLNSSIQFVLQMAKLIKFVHQAANSFLRSKLASEHRCWLASKH